MYWVSGTRRRAWPLGCWQPVPLPALRARSASVRLRHGPRAPASGARSAGPLAGALPGDRRRSDPPSRGARGGRPSDGDGGPEIGARPASLRLRRGPRAPAGRARSAGSFAKAPPGNGRRSNPPSRPPTWAVSAMDIRALARGAAEWALQRTPNRRPNCARASRESKRALGQEERLARRTFGNEAA